MQGPIVAMHGHPHNYNLIDDALRSWIIHYILNVGLFDADTNKSYGYPYETIRSITRVFEEKNDWLASKHMRCSLSKFTRQAHSKVSREASCRSRQNYRISSSLAEWSFSIPTSCIYQFCFKSHWSQDGLILKLMRYELNDLNNDIHYSFTLVMM